MGGRRTVAVLTDFGADSFYVGVMKGVLHGAAPDAHVVDVTHSIEPHAVDRASYVLARVFEYFAPGTVFLAVVDPGVGGGRRDLVIETGGRYIVGPDNGLVTELDLDANDFRAFAIDPSRLSGYQQRAPVGRTFLGRDVYAPAAAAIATGVAPSALGTPFDGALARIDVPGVAAGPGTVSGRARYVDRFGNILTGITGRDLQRAFGDTPTEEIRARINNLNLGRICGFYGERPPGSLAAILNSWDVIEVSVTEGRAVDRFPGRGLDELTVELYSGEGVNSTT
jgi:S-adenosylmethionine hydrolase